MRILIIRLSAIGDIFQTFTVARDLRIKYPKATLDWLVDDKFTNVAKMCADVDNVISIPFKQWKKNPLSLIYNILTFKRDLKKSGNRYDLILETHGLLKPALFARFLFKGKVLGLDKKSANDGVIASFFYNNIFRVSRDNVAIIRFRGLASKALGTDNKKPHSISLNCINNSFNFVNYIVLLHGTSKASKKLKIEDWAKICNYILVNTDKNLVMTHADDSESDFCKKLSDNLSSDRFYILDTVSFETFAKVIDDSEMVVGLDTGFTHLANLMNKKVIGIYKDSNPNHVGLLESKIAKNFDYRCNPVNTDEINQNISKILSL